MISDDIISIIGQWERKSRSEPPFFLYLESNFRTQNRRKREHAFPYVLSVWMCTYVCVCIRRSRRKTPLMEWLCLSFHEQAAPVTIRSYRRTKKRDRRLVRWLVGIGKAQLGDIEEVGEGKPSQVYACIHTGHVGYKLIPTHIHIHIRRG